MPADKAGYYDSGMLGSVPVCLTAFSVFFGRLFHVCAFVSLSVVKRTGSYCCLQSTLTLETRRDLPKHGHFLLVQLVVN